MKFSHLFILLVGVCVAVFSSCQEFLPARSDPTDYFKGDIEVSYIYNQQRNGIVFIIYLTNNFDEILSETLKFDGSLQIEWIAPAEDIGLINPIRNVKLKSEYLNAHGNNHQTGVLTIDPYDTVRIVYTWDFKFDDSTDVRTVQYFQKNGKIINCPNKTDDFIEHRIVFRSQPFRVQCRIKLFDRLAAVTIPEKILYSCSINFWPKEICGGMIVPSIYQTPCDLR